MATAASSSAVHVEVDFEDADSTLGSEVSSDTTSLASYIYDYRHENGRTYHAFKDGKYWGPNDEQANEHLDLAHHLFTLTFDGRLFLAPVSNPLEVLDLGTGTGIWAVDVADEFPEATVTGIDLSPIQPNWLPVNCRFEIDDVENEWTFAENKFDLIHIRALHGSIADWPALYKQCLKCLKPGGYIEQAEYNAQPFLSEDNSIPENSALAEFNAVGPATFAKLNRELQIFSTMRNHIVSAGFDSVTEHNFKWPVGPWPRDKKMKEIGLWARAHLEMGLENWTLRLLTTVLGWSVEKVLLLCANVRKEMRNPDIHAIHQMNVVFARKPMAPGQA